MIRLFFLIALFLVHATCEGMNTYKFHEENWTKSRLSEEAPNTEEMAMRLLEENPVDADVDYIAVPWKHRLVKFIKSEIPFKSKYGFTVCQHIAFRRLIPLFRKIGIKVVFSTHAMTRDKYHDIEVIPFPIYPYQSVDPAPCKEILCSFIGTGWTHSCRQEIADTLENEPGFFIKLRGGQWWFDIKDAEQKSECSEEYCEVLARSRFSLCPRGTGPASIRFWESLRAGAIPIVISDGWELPQSFDWEEAIIRVPQDSIAEIPKILSEISPEKEEQMREKCIEAHHLFSNENLISVIHDYFSR